MAQVIVCTKAMASDQYCKENLGLGKAIGEVDPAKLNINGGAIVLGHPVGATGNKTCSAHCNQAITAF